MRDVTMPRSSPADIRQYYDRHTSAFVAFGQGGNVGAIHRAVRVPGVRTREEAFRYVEDYILDRIRQLDVAAPYVVDLGCGVGASLCYLAERLPSMMGIGITLSPVQAQLAEQLIQRAGLVGRVRCLEDDYNDLPTTLRSADLAYAIESFVHGSDPARFLAQCRKLVRPGGVLVICDDFRRPLRAGTNARAGTAIERFRRCWHINTLVSASELQALARGAGFEHDSTLDLSRYLELDRPRDRVIGIFAAMVGWIPALSSRFGPLLGGSALQRCLKRGWIGYDLAVFR